MLLDCAELLLDWFERNAVVAVTSDAAHDKGSCSTAAAVGLESCSTAEGGSVLSCIGNSILLEDDAASANRFSPSG